MQNDEFSGKTYAEMIEASFKPKHQHISVGDKIDCKIAAITRDSVFLDLGMRVEAMAERADFETDGQLTVKEGDSVTVYITGREQGVFRCAKRLGSASMEAADTDQRAIQTALQDAFRAGVPVDGVVRAQVKGGFEVQVMGQRAFCPLSQIELKFCEKPESHVGRSYSFILAECSEHGRNIVVSRKKILQLQNEEKANVIWESLASGAVFDGIVTSVQEYGAFVDIGGVEGLLHVSEISYERVADANAVLEKGQQLKVAIKDIDRERRKISLSMKALLEDPWAEASGKLSAGGEFTGKVTRIKPFGAFIELFPGIEGLLHISRLGGERRVLHPKEVLTPGDMVTVRVIEIDNEKRTISLTMEEAPVDYSSDLEKIKKDQDKKSSATTIGSLFDEALAKKE